MGQFSFMVHPLNLKYVTDKYSFTRWMPKPMLKGLLRIAPPFKVSTVRGIQSPYGQAQGHFVACPVTSEQFVLLPEAVTVRKVIAAGRLAERMGAGVVGLGAFTAVVGGGGKAVADALDIAVTTGNSYTVATAVEGARKAVKAMNYRLEDCALGIIGATGSIGMVCAEMLAPDVGELILMGRDDQRLQAVEHRMKERTGVFASVFTDLSEALPQCDIIVAASSAYGALIEPEHLKPGAIVCDVARPRDVSERVSQLRDDVLVIEGGIVSVPGAVDFGLDFGTPPGTCMACMAETIILAMEERYENYTIGRDLSVEQVQTIERLAKKHGFSVSGFRAFERQLTSEEIAGIRERADAQR